MALEINLVPDIKGEMIKALKIRNFILFLCIVIASASVGVVLIFASIAGGQQAAVEGKQATIKSLSEKINEYSDLSKFLTIRDQLSNLSSIADNKKVISRTFNALSALIPTGADTVKISELTIDLTPESGDPALTFDAQANAGSEPFIDYNVLDSFKKSMQYMRYDYGVYVDKYGNEIPAYCMIENDANGSFFRDQDKNRYAYWLITGEGCNPSLQEETQEEEELDEEEGSNSLSSLINATVSVAEGYELEEYEGQTVVRIWRTPRFNDWYKKNPIEGEPYMNLDGNIENVAHFESACITYTGTENNGSVSWKNSNESCLLVPNGTEGIIISDSSNGRDSDDELVLRFSATINISEEFFDFKNHHMIALPPSGRYNVTDSYVQIQGIFTERASDCEVGDTECSSAAKGDD